MGLAKYSLLIVAATLAVGGAELGFAQDSATFDSVPAVAGCSVKTASVAARSDTDCALLNLADATKRSFSFIKGVCTLSDSKDCAAPGAGAIFVDVNRQYKGYELQLDARRFWVFQQRLVGRVAFNRTWVEYEQGFGEGVDGIGTEFWAGLQQISAFTKSHNSSLRIEMTTMNGTSMVGEWLNCSVGGASTNYTLNYAAFVNASSNFSLDALDMHKGMQFSTIDRDNDLLAESCSFLRGFGGFWFNSCIRINPNALYPSTLLVDSDPASFPFMRCNGMTGCVTVRFTRMMLQF